MSECLNCRQVLQTMLVIGFILDASVFTNINSAVIVMVKTNNTTSSNFGPQFEWSALEKNNLLGSFYLGVMCFEAIGGRLGEFYGPKKIRFLSIFLTSVATLFQPLACTLGYKLAYATRFFTGIFIAPSISSSTLLIVNWFAPSERTKSLAAISAFNLGVAISMQIFGLLLYYFGWPSIFYANSVVGVIWSIIFWYLIYNTPEEHPRITCEEKQHIDLKMSKEACGVRKTKKNLPLRKIFFCVPFLAIVLSRFCYGCLNGVIKFQLPTYLNDVLHFNTKENGFFSSLPFIGYTAFEIFICRFANKLLKSNRFSKTNVRKLLECSSLLVIALSLVLLAFWGLNSTITMILFIISLIAMASFTPGHFANIIDISPNFSGTLIGITTTFFSIAAWLSTVLIGLISKYNNSFGGWQIIFWSMGGFCAVCALSYALFASAEIQYWNDLDLEKKSSDEENMTPLKANEN